MLYLTLSEANDYFSARVGSENWDLAGDSLKEKSLNHAERNLSRLAYRDLAVTKGLIFPRGTQTEVPTRVKESICEEALALLNGIQNETEMSDLHVSSTSGAGFTATVNAQADRPWIGLGLTSPIAWALISPYLKDPNSFNVATA